VGNYVAILDESIQIGREKLQEDRSIAAPLTSHDVEVLGLEVQQSWTGDNITDFMHRQLDRLPLMKLSYIISDSGANLRKSFRIIGVDQVGDCSHIMMNAAKKLLQNNKVLSQLATKIGQRRSQLMQTSEGYLLPGALRDKDRFLRIFTIVKWIERIDAYWSKLPQSSRNKLGFIEQARPLIKCMAQLKELIEITSAVLKYAGLSSISEHKWEQRILDYREKYNLTAEGLAFIEMIRKYFKGHVDLIAQHGRLICCSDIIESTFGRYKNKGGTPVISADVLSISLYNKDITIEMVTKALTGVPYKEVHQWEQHYTCDNRYSIVRRMNRELKSIA
jgi:hypothetical protein